MIRTIVAAAGSGSGVTVGVLVGIIGGSVLRVLVARFTGADPRPVRVWVAELVVVGIPAAGLGALSPLISGWPAPTFVAGVASYAAAGGAFGYLGGRELEPGEPWRWALAHLVASLGAGAVGFTLGLLATSGLG